MWDGSHARPGQVEVSSSQEVPESLPGPPGRTSQALAQKYPTPGFWKTPRSAGASELPEGRVSPACGKERGGGLHEPLLCCALSASPVGVQRGSLCPVSLGATPAEVQHCAVVSGGQESAVGAPGSKTESTRAEPFPERLLVLGLGWSQPHAPQQCQSQRGIPPCGPCPWGPLRPPQPEPTPRRGTIISKKGTEITFRSENDLIHGFSMKRKQTFCGLFTCEFGSFGLSCSFFCFPERTGGFLRGAPQPDAVTRGCAGHQGGVGGPGEPGPQQPCDHFCLSLKAPSWKVGTAGDRRPGVMGMS